MGNANINLSQWWTLYPWLTSCPMYHSHHVRIEPLSVTPVHRAISSYYSVQNVLHSLPRYTTYSILETARKRKWRVCSILLPTNNLLPPHINQTRTVLVVGIAVSVVFGRRNEPYLRRGRNATFGWIVNGFDEWGEAKWPTLPSFFFPGLECVLKPLWYMGAPIEYSGEEIYFRPKFHNIGGLINPSVLKNSFPTL